MVDDGVAQRPGDLVLQRLDALRLELDDVAGLDVDQVVVVVAAGLLEARGAALEGMAVDGAYPLQELHGAVDGG